MSKTIRPGPWEAAKPKPGLSDITIGLSDIIVFAALFLLAFCSTVELLILLGVI